jgi:hypothetical protein
MTNILERRLNDSGGSTRYEVLNFGRPGSETVDHIDILRHSVLANRPDFVVLQWYINDVQGRHWKDRSTAWGLPLQRISRWLQARSGLYYLANGQWGRLQRAIGLAPGHEDHYVREFGDPDAPGARAAHDALLEFVKLCRDAGIPVGIVTFPDLVENLLNGYPLGFLLDRVMALCRELGIPCVDLRREFARITPTSRLWVNRLDRHPGPLANQLAADVVLERFGMIWVGHEAERVRQATR